jgi:hypothetical protein
MIKISTEGTTRRPVVIVGPWALKFARGDRGRRCNLYEANLYRTTTPERRAMLCPVRWCSRKGFLLIAQTAAPLDPLDHADLLARDAFPDWDYMPGEDGDPTESKQSDWGRIDGRLVALDYSTPAHLTEQESDELLNEAIAMRQQRREKDAPSDDVAR